MADEIHHPDRPAGDAGWPMPSPEMRRLLQPVPLWGPTPAENAEPSRTDGGGDG